MNYEELRIRLRELYDKIRNNDYIKNESNDSVKAEFNEVFLNIVTASTVEQKYFSYSPLTVYITHFKQETEICKNESLDFYEDEHLKNEYLKQITILNLSKDSIHKYLYYLYFLDQSNYNIFLSILKKRIQYLEELLYKNGIEVNVSIPTEEFESSKTTFKKHYNLIAENDNPQPLSSKPKTNKSLIFEGSPLNLSERFKMANKVLGIDKKIRILNIPDLEKYQLLAYILEIDKDNARNLMNGNYKSKDRDLSTYFNDLGLNK
jgi:hypothetical protein